MVIDVGVGVAVGITVVAVSVVCVAVTVVEVVVVAVVVTVVVVVSGALLQAVNNAVNKMNMVQMRLTFLTMFFTTLLKKNIPLARTPSEG